MIGAKSLEKAMDGFLVFKKMLVLFSLFFLTASCTNIFYEAADKNSDAAKLFDARKLIDSGDWTSAITKINSMSVSAREQRDVKALLASAYAGRCGLDVLTMINNMQATTSYTFFQILMRSIRGATATNVADCVLAETTMKTISTSSSSRTTDENLLMAFVGFAKIGAILSANADTDSDGTVDAGFNPCTALDDTEAAELVTGLANAITSLNSANSSIGSDEMTDINSICAAATTAGFDFCSLTDTSQVDTQAERAGMRGLVHEAQDSIGLGTCTSTLPSNILDAASCAATGNTGNTICGT